MFTIKRIEIESSHKLIAMILDEDAKELSLYPNQRVKVINPQSKSHVICVLDIVNYHKKGLSKEINLRHGEIGLFDRAFDKLGIRENLEVLIIPAEKPKSLELIKQKAMGKRLLEDEFKEILLDITENRFSDIETTYFVIACSIHQLNDKETTALTKAMVDVGKVLDFRKHKDDIVIDKHCIGGIPGNRTSMIVTPIVAAAGLKIPKSSSRAITSPAGTADTMEVLANVEIPLTKMYEEVTKIGGCLVWGGGLELSPADDLIIHVEHPLEIDSEGQMIASILSKKKSVGSTHVLIDIPIGATAKVKTKDHAKHLKKRFEKIGKAIDMKLQVIITDGKEPIGDGIGPLYEALDVLKVLKNEEGASLQLRRKSLYMAGLMLEMANVAKKGEGYPMAREILDSGKAFEKFNQIIDFQGRKAKTPDAKYSYNVYSKFSGKVKSIDNLKISKLAFILGAPEDKAAGLIIHKKLGSIVEGGDILFEIYSNSELKMKYAKTYLDENLIYYIR